ncbi:MAG: peptidase [Acidimicrobiales bacterium]|nr:peptidase [Acidimicrobiales bacterium]
MHLTQFEIIFYAVLIPSIILHEVSHGWVALAFGDDTAKRAGRLTLNPVAHVDPFGTIILPLILVLTTGRAFGYAKPVPVNPRNLRNPREQSVLVSLAGPGINIAIALAAALVLRMAGLGNLDLFKKVVYGAGYANVILAAFNLIPIPPLDGSAVIERFLPQAWWPRYMKVRQYSMGILLILVLLLPQFLGHIFSFVIDQWLRLL